MALVTLSGAGYLLSSATATESITASAFLDITHLENLQRVISKLASNPLQPNFLCSASREATMDTLIRAIQSFFVTDQPNIGIQHHRDRDRDRDRESRSSPIQHRSSPVFTRSPPAVRSSPTPNLDYSDADHPVRPILPLPKRRLRDRLSAEQSKNLIFPPAPPLEPSSLFAFPYPAPPAPNPRELHAAAGGHVGEHDCEQCGHDRDGLDSDDEAGHSTAGANRYPVDPRNAGGAGYSKLGGRGAYLGKVPPPQPPDSANSSVDGYESFENTSNKKKRKIPQSNGVGSHGPGHGHHSALSADLANMGISPREGDATAGAGRAGLHGDDGDRGVGSYYGNGTSSSNSAGAGGSAGLSPSIRGRFGRSGRGLLDRRPLGTSTNGLNAHAAAGARARPSYLAKLKTGKSLCTSWFLPGLLSPSLP
jgi:hypothetical protein